MSMLPKQLRPKPSPISANTKRLIGFFGGDPTAGSGPRADPSIRKEPSVPKFSVTVSALTDTGLATMNLSVQVEASDSLAAIDASKAELARILAQAGLAVKPAS
jgi:hypothetical protein